MAEPLPPIITDFFQGKLLCVGPSARITVEFDFDTLSRATAKSNLGILLEAHRRLLSGGWKVKKAHVSQKTVKRDASNLFPVGMGPVQLSTDAAGPPVVIEPCNNPSVGFLMRCQCTNGHWEMRLLRGLRDSFITDNWFDVTVVNPSVAGFAVNGPYLGGTNPPTYAVLPATDTPSDIVKNYCSLVRDLTKVIRPVAGAPGSYRAFPIKLVQFQGVGEHQVGVATGVPRGRQPAWK